MGQETRFKSMYDPTLGMDDRCPPVDGFNFAEWRSTLKEAFRSLAHSPYEHCASNPIPWRNVPDVVAKEGDRDFLSTKEGGVLSVEQAFMHRYFKVPEDAFFDFDIGGTFACSSDSMWDDIQRGYALASRPNGDG